MKTGQISRESILNDLIEFAKPISVLSSSLAQLSWDYEGAGIALRPRHMIDVLQRYLRAEISAQEVEDWANLIEAREDVQLSIDKGGELAEIVYELANPTLTQELDRTRAAALINSLISMEPVK